MVHQGLTRALSATLLLAGLACLHHPPPAAVPVAGVPASTPEAGPPAAPREFRAAWVATVAHIDWPSRRGLDPEAQRAEAKAILARARDLGLNALILQVRPACDALYPSALEPWSEYLTGAQGRAPEPPWDPLAFWIEEAHRAGLELHAWFNPYRARHASAASPLADGHISRTRPDLVRTYGDQLWLDPAEDGALDHTLAVIADVVRRYDLDGVHVDDYFYPYPVKDAAGSRVDFPDGAPWEAYRAAGGALGREDWRRSRVDAFIRRMYREVHRIRPQARVGISPFGLGRPDRRPPGVSGFSQFDDLYADVEGWLQAGWLDYLAPQLYWLRESPGQPFAPLLDGWLAENPRGRHLWPGLFTSRLLATPPWPATEIAAQIGLVREREGAGGHVHFSMAALMRDPDGLGGRLRDLYGAPALVPASPWLGGAPPPSPPVTIDLPAAGGEARVACAGEAPWLLAVWARYGPTWRFFVLPGGSGSLPAAHGGLALDRAVVTAVGRTGLESPRVQILPGRY